ncbi:hypothetical protein KP509_24G066100 [Ceratopteris richardii]|nr:hypothetical protein KP509_24G066100 [Ceratopteris richardii]
MILRRSTRTKVGESSTRGGKVLRLQKRALGFFSEGRHTHRVCNSLRAQSLQFSQGIVCDLGQLDPGDDTEALRREQRRCWFAIVEGWRSSFAAEMRFTQESSMAVGPCGKVIDSKSLDSRVSIQSSIA